MPTRRLYAENHPQAPYCGARETSITAGTALIFNRTLRLKTVRKWMACFTTGYTGPETNYEPYLNIHNRIRANYVVGMNSPHWHYKLEAK